MSTPSHTPFESSRFIGHAAAPLALLVGGLATLLVAGHGPQELAASTSTMGLDYDMDGLADVQESVLGTSPDDVDSDFDGYPDLEEIARKSDPLDPAAVPGTEELGIGMYAHTAGGFLNIGSAIYVKGGRLANLDYRLGIVLNGTPVSVGPSFYGKAAKTFFYTATADPSDLIVVVELPVPESFAVKRGVLNVYSTIMNLAAPEIPGAVDVANIIDFGGTLAMIQDSPGAVSGGAGVIYRPLSEEEEIPATWSSGQVCWQNTTAVGTVGSSILYEVDQAGCEEMDSYCNPGDCSASVGSSVELPDPGALLGG